MALRPIINSPYLSYDPDPYNMGGLNSLNTPMTDVSIPGTNLNNIPATNLNNFVAEQEQYTDSGDDQTPSLVDEDDSPLGTGVGPMPPLGAGRLASEIVRSSSGRPTANVVLSGHPDVRAGPPCNRSTQASA